MHHCTYFEHQRMCISVTLLRSNVNIFTTPFAVAVVRALAAVVLVAVTAKNSHCVTTILADDWAILTCPVHRICIDCLGQCVLIKKRALKLATPKINGGSLIETNDACVSLKCWHNLINLPQNLDKRLPFVLVKVDPRLDVLVAFVLPIVFKNDVILTIVLLVVHPTFWIQLNLLFRCSHAWNVTSKFPPKL